MKFKVSVTNSLKDNKDNKAKQNVMPDGRMDGRTNRANKTNFQNWGDLFKIDFVEY